MEILEIKTPVLYSDEIASEELILLSNNLILIPFVAEIPNDLKFVMVLVIISGTKSFKLFRLIAVLNPDMLQDSTDKLSNLSLFKTEMAVEIPV
ncbi:MAG TPA: hypothetical protein PL018_14165 [Ignavibacteriaceae bacterium]|nr:hypothetical protein [Ignavibacteriaceae bacterium]HRP94143.1 hypothetical protein [Ignavibacteriaceae bacterium]HRQ55400.1 hypothetical protein [Ignavibacteriaceae bacterium]